MTAPATARAAIPDAPAEYRLPAVLSIELGVMPGLILHRRCTCPQGAWAIMPVRLLIRYYSQHRTLAELLPRMTCKHCHRRPTILLSDSMHTDHCGGPPPGWSVVLVEGEASEPPRRRPASIMALIKS